MADFGASGYAASTNFTVTFGLIMPPAHVLLECAPRQSQADATAFLARV